MANFVIQGLNKISEKVFKIWNTFEELLTIGPEKIFEPARKVYEEKYLELLNEKFISKVIWDEAYEYVTLEMNAE